MAPLYTVLLALLLSASSTIGQQLMFSVVENGEVNQTLGQVATGGADFRFDGPEANFCSMYFDITNGTLTTKVSIDREQVEATTDSDVLGCVVAYTEDTEESSPATKSISIHILDENDNEPRFFKLNQPEVRTIPENLDVPTPILRLEPVDKDKGENGTTTFEITHGNDQKHFSIDRALGDREDSTTRILNLVSTINVDSSQEFNLTVTIRDMGEDPKVFDQVIIINIDNLPAEPPTFAVTSVMYMVAEDHQLGAEYPFANITAANREQVQGDIFYSLRPLGGSDISMLSVNEFTGELFLQAPLDFEPLGQVIWFYIEAFNPSINSGDDVTASITIVDVNDNVPYVQKCVPCYNGNRVTLVEGSLNLMIVEAILINDEDGSDVFKRISSDLNINVSDPDVGLIHSVVENFPQFISQISLTLDKPIDRETSPNFTIQVTFENEAEPHWSNSTLLLFDVLDINDNSPTFSQDSYTVRVAEGTPIGKEISTLQAFDGDNEENGTITYSIMSVDNPLAYDWLSISPTSGILTVASADIDYNLVGGRVILNVSATDHGYDPLVGFVEVVLEISPTLTFPPNSYIAFNHFDLITSQEYSLYLELRTKQTEGVILFQQSISGNVVFLELTGGYLIFNHELSNTAQSDLAVSDDKWYSILVQKQDDLVTLQVWETQQGPGLVAETLMGATLFGCDVPESVMASDALFIGGVNLFALDDSVPVGSTEFVGTIRNVLINDTQVDLGCPTSQVNVLQGFHYSDACTTEGTAFCENDHTTGCVDYAPEPYCKCLGGFPPASCQPIQNPDPDIQGAHDSFAPIRFYGNTRADLQLDYAFFSDLEIQRRLADAQSTTQRRKREDAQTSNRTIQTIELTFKMVDVHSSVLLYSQTPTTIHRIQINEASEDTHAIVYMVNNVGSNTARIHIPVQWSLRNMTVYHVRVIISEDMALVSVEDGEEHSEKAGRWNDNNYAAFVEQPTSLISLGGAEGGNGYLEGCISRLAIDSIEVPLSGLLAIPPEDGGFVAGSNETRPPTMYCELCDVTVCEENRQCLREAMGEPTCNCLPGLNLVDSTCVPIAVPLDTPDPNLQYIIIGSVCAGVLILLIVLVIVFIRVCHKKRDRQKRTYSVSNMNIDIAGTTSSQTSKPNQYVHMEPRDNPMMTTLSTANGTPRHDRGSSVSTFQEHAEDGDPETETPMRLSRRKSTVSAESGIKTDTDQETSLRSIPRMEDSGNEKDTDYSEGESASDDLSSTCFVQSPIGVHLIGSSNSITAVASSVSSPHTLTPKERQMITPLRPPSTALSATDFEDNHGRVDQGTDSEDTFPYGHHTLPASLSRNSSARRSGRRGSDSGDTSQVSSACSGAHWYKASTASDNERERERSRANRAYYSQHSEPGKYPPPPEYLSPPTFEPKSDKGVLYPNTRRSRVPINIPESPGSASKNAMYQFPCDDSHVRAPRLRYDNHRLKHEYSLPKGHPSIALSSASSSSGRPRHNAEAMLASAYPQLPQHVVANYPRHYSTSGPGSSIPHHTNHYQYSRSYSSEDKPEQQQFKDLKSVSTINPISYWEMQDRMKTVVDQVDPYQILSEPYIQFEDVSTDPSVIESQITQEGPEHQSFCSQGGGERPADFLDPRLSLSELQDNSTIASDTDIGPPIPIFPSADCSSPYTATLVASSSTSGTSTPKTPNVFTIPTSQYHYDV